MEENIKEMIGRNLRLSREAARLSQEGFADLLKISRQTLSSIENGKVAPDSAKLLEASRILGCPVTDFFREEEEKVELLCRAAEHVKPTPETRSRFQRLSRSYRELEEIVGVAESSISPPEYSFYPEAYSNPEEFAFRVARSERDRLGLGPSEPIENIFKLLEENGVRIVFEGIQQDGISGVSGYSRRYGPCILVNYSQTLERNIFTVAHEFGHLLMHRYLYQPSDCDTVQDGQIEKMAHQFAAAFLVPEIALRDTFAKNVGSRTVGMEDVVFLKYHFRVSAEVMLRRIARLGLAPADHCDQLLSQAKQIAGERNEYLPLKSEQLEEYRRLNRFIHLQRKAALEGMVTVGRLAELLGKSVIEARSLVSDWRRSLELVPA